MRHDGPGTLRRQKREAMEQAKQMMRDSRLLDLPPEPPTRQQKRKIARTLAKSKHSIEFLERLSKHKRRGKLSNNEKRRLAQLKEYARANS